MKVLDIDVFVRSRLPLAPEQETFLGGHFFNRNVLDSKAFNKPASDYFLREKLLHSGEL